jgi:hypothetical protein
MKTALAALGLLLSAALAASAQMRESDRTLNLKGLETAFARAIDTRLFLSLTNPPPAILSLTNTVPTPLKRRNPTDSRRGIQVLLGKDVIGWAEVTSYSQSTVPTRPKEPEITSTSLALTFEKDEQAARAAEALRLANVGPKPLLKSRDAK